MLAIRLLVYFAFCVPPATAFGDVLAICGASTGHAYYPPGRFVSKEKSGWTQDSISDGSFQLIRNGADYDIVFTDASGGTLSAKGDGGNVVAVQDPSGNLLVHVVYPGKTLETYIFWFAITGERTVTYSLAKYGAMLPKHSLLSAKCRW